MHPTSRLLNRASTTAAICRTLQEPAQPICPPLFAVSDSAGQSFAEARTRITVQVSHGAWPFGLLADAISSHDQRSYICEALGCRASSKVANVWRSRWELGEVEKYITYNYIWKCISNTAFRSSEIDYLSCRGPVPRAVQSQSSGMACPDAFRKAGAYPSQ